MQLFFAAVVSPALLVHPVVHTRSISPRHPVIIADATAVASAVTDAAPMVNAAMSMSSLDMSDPTVIGAAVAVLGLGAFAASSKEDAPAAAPTITEVEPAPAPPPPAPKEWPLRGGPGGPHPKAGPWPRDAPRELWTPPLGWKPPTKPVTSWYDRGGRLVAAPAPVAPAPPSAAPSKPSLSSMWDSFVASFNQPKAASGSANAQESWALVGGPGGPHPKRGPWPRDPPRELWTPPPGWTPPTKPAVSSSTVASWYDSGKRL